MRTIESEDIADSGEFGSRSGGAKPITIKRAISNDVTNFLSKVYIW